MRTNVCLALLGALLVPSVASAQPADPDAAPNATQPPATVVVTPQLPAPTTYTGGPAYEEVSEYNAPMFTSGALVFAASYGASVIVAASGNNERGNNRLYVPVVGPWLALNDRGSCDITKTSCDHETTAKVLLVADGIFQAAGVLGMVDGLLQPTTRRVVRTAKRQPNVHLAPTLTNGNPGFAALGKF